MADSTRIQVDAAGLHDFSTKLQTSVDKDIIPTAQRVKNQLQFYASFGVHSASPAVQQAALDYWRRMEEAMRFLDTLAHNAATLAKVAQEIVTTYREADGQSADFLQTVQGGASTEVTNDERTANDAKQQARAAEERDRLDENRQLHSHGAGR
ncbi:hypothetical protein [Dactylosporangium sp. CA-092794]|uniref:hypothetical protein n=1 Tax=Dactylosporangium sp. CA-092794 TaxID=3239929 RepID=UPI003D947490